MSEVYKAQRWNEKSQPYEAKGKNIKMLLPESVIEIFYKDRFGDLHKEKQGKFFYQNNKPVYLADMTPNKWWRNYGGYSIAKQILDAFSKVKVKPEIIYRVVESATLYTTNATTFKKKGILVAYGSHEQYVLPIKNWKATNGVIKDPHNLPVIQLSKWVKGITPTPIDAQPQINLDVKFKLAQIWKEKYA